MIKKYRVIDDGLSVWGARIYIMMLALHVCSLWCPKLWEGSWHVEKEGKYEWKGMGGVWKVWKLTSPPI